MMAVTTYFTLCRVELINYFELLFFPEIIDHVTICIQGVRSVLYIIYKILYKIRHDLFPAVYTMVFRCCTTVWYSGTIFAYNRTV